MVDMVHPSSEAPTRGHRRKSSARCAQRPQELTAVDLSIQARVFAGFVEGREDRLRDVRLRVALGAAKSKNGR